MGINVDPLNFESDDRCLLTALEDDEATAKARRAHQQRQLSGDMTMPALPTAYCGTMFRSALEASWAATLDSLGLRWEYEPQMVTLPSGARYLPDFRLPDVGTWIEVKGQGVPGVEKAHEFSKSLLCDCPRGQCSCRWHRGELVLIGHQPHAFNPADDEDYRDWNGWQRAVAQRRHRGHISWTSTRGPNSWLGQCRACETRAWFDSRLCRACGEALVWTTGHRSGSPNLGFVRIVGVMPDEHGNAA